MGKLEERSKKRTRRGQIETAVLGSLALAGIATVALVSPNVLQLLKRIDPGWASKRDPRQRLREVAYRLKHKGYVEFIREQGSTRMRITPKGAVALSVMTIRSTLPVRPRRWDGKWRLVIFDIPEKRRTLRQQVRTLVARYGFVRLQDSVWVYPYDCEELIMLLKASLKIGVDMRYIIADVIEFDAPLKAHFDLK